MENEMTDEQLRTLYEEYKADIAEIEALGIEAPKIVDPNA